MNFFKHHIGDYASATSHLSWDEDMAYTRLMRVYYRDERSLPAEPRQVYRLTSAQSKVQRQAVDTILAEFFTKLDDGWHNKRCDEEIGQAKAQADTNRRIAEERETKRARNGHESLDGSSTNGATNRQPIQTPDSRLQYPDSNTPTPTPPKGGAGFGRRSPARAEKDQALEVWNRLTGSNGADPPRDSRLQAAIDAVGGWTRIAQRERGIDDQRVKQDFVEAYRGAS